MTREFRFKKFSKFLAGVKSEIKYNVNASINNYGLPKLK
jgi:hypothetical protein